MDPLHVAIAMIPLAMYLLLIGWINLSTHPFVTTGGRDLAAVAVAASGFMICGPLELFLPETAASIVHGWVWLPMILLFALIVTLFILMMRPRLIVYNVSAHQLRPALERVVRELDPQATWAGDCMVAPQLGVQLGIESFTGIRNVTIASVGTSQDLDGWRRIEFGLKAALNEIEQTPNAQGFSYIFLAILLTAGVVYSLMNGRQELAQAFREMLRM